MNIDIRMISAIREFQCQTGETDAGYPIVSVSVRVQLCKRGEISCIDTRSMRDQIQKAVVSTIAIAETKGE